MTHRGTAGPRSQVSTKPPAAPTRQDERSVQIERDSTGASSLAFPCSSSILYFVFSFIALFLSFYRSELFFYLDEYASIWRLAEAPSLLQYALIPNNQHFVPIFKIFYALEIWSFGERYGLYVLVNIALLSAAGVVWRQWMRQMGVPNLLASSVPFASLTAACQAENVMWGFQSSAILCTLALLGVLHFYFQRSIPFRTLTLVLLSVCAAFTFANAYVLPAVLCVYFGYDWYTSVNRARRLLFQAFGFAALFIALVVCASRIAGTDKEAVDVLSGGPARILWVAWYACSIAFYGPFAHLFARNALEIGPSFVPTIFSLVFCLGLILLCWKSDHRHCVIKLLFLQLSLFVLIAPFRNNPVFVGFSDRYYTLGMLPLLSSAAIVATHLARRSKVPVYVMAGFLTVLGGYNMLRWSVRDDWGLVEYGRASRFDYYATKSWLLRHRDKFVSNHLFNQSVAPWLSLDQLISIFNVLDSTFTAGQPRSKTAHYVENAANERGWGPICDGQSASQTLKVNDSYLLTKIDLLVSRSSDFTGSAEISLSDDAGNEQWTTTVAGHLWPMNRWLAIPVDMVPLAGGRTYTIKVATHAKQGQWLTVWINGSPKSYPFGDTRTPEGIVGDFCFRLTLVTP